MKIPKKAVKGAAARLAAMQSKHGSEEKGEKHGAMTNPMSYREEMSEQKKEMSKTKRGKR